MDRYYRWLASLGGSRCAVSHSASSCNSQFLSAPLICTSDRWYRCESSRFAQIECSPSLRRRLSAAKPACSTVSLLAHACATLATILRAVRALFAMLFAHVSARNLCHFSPTVFGPVPLECLASHSPLHSLLLERSVRHEASSSLAHILFYCQKYWLSARGTLI